jgi:hypothetical protein
MKELTAAQGKLRCGECGSVFNAMDSLSTKLPEQPDPSEKISFESLNKKQLDSYRTKKPKALLPVPPPKPVKKLDKKLLGLATATVLTGLLATQVWATKDTWLQPSKDPAKIKMTSRKVFSHPNEPNALIITGLIENTSHKAQPYPFLEAKLLDSNNKVVALRRFRPEEYLEQYTPETLIKSLETTSIRLKIQDPPGNRAKHFKFSFL